MLYRFLCNALQRASQKTKIDIASNRSEEHTSELQSHSDLVCRLLLEKKNTNLDKSTMIIHEAGIINRDELLINTERNDRCHRTLRLHPLFASGLLPPPSPSPRHDMPQ